MTVVSSSDERLGQLKCLLDGEGREGDLNDHAELIGWAVQELECRPRISLRTELAELRELAEGMHPHGAAALRAITRRIDHAVNPKYVPVIGEDGKPTGYHRDVKTREVVTL